MLKEAPFFHFHDIVQNVTPSNPTSLGGVHRHRGDVVESETEGIGEDLCIRVRGRVNPIQSGQTPQLPIHYIPTGWVGL
eukprot:3540093-Pyramimonas_sp.AAC.1